MSKQLVDKDKAFEIFFSLGTSRTLSKLHRQLDKKYPKSSPSYPTLKNWAKSGKWKAACEGRDQEVSEKVNDVMMPAWVDVQVRLIQMFIDQLEGGIKAGIVPENSRDMVAISKELRGLLGEADKHEVEFTGIEYVLTETKED